MMSLFRFIFLSFLKIIGKIIYPSKLYWLDKKDSKWSDISLVLVLNHTSLFEFVYSVTLPFTFLWRISTSLVMPVADKTMKKPIAGFIFKHLSPYTITLTRKRDESWQYFLDHIEKDRVCIFMPEGQMKRKNGLDKNGRPMKVKTGVYDLLSKYKDKKVAIVYSHGLHHIFAPEDKFPKLFKRISAHIEVKDVSSFLSSFENKKDPRLSLVSYLEKRRDQFCH